MRRTKFLYIVFEIYKDFAFDISDKPHFEVHIKQWRSETTFTQFLCVFDVVTKIMVIKLGVSSAS